MPKRGTSSVRSDTAVTFPPLRLNIEVLNVLPSPWMETATSGGIFRASRLRRPQHFHDLDPDGSLAS